MKLENQVCTLEQAKRLKELGVSAPALISWYPNARSDKSTGTEVINDGIGLTDAVSDAAGMWGELNLILPAYTVAELGVMLPSEWGKPWNQSFWPVRRNYLDWVGGDEDSCIAEVTTEAQCRAAVLIGLLESGKVQASEVNARLT